MGCERKYKDALDRARECMKDGAISQNTIDYLCNIFPELKESEDELTWLTKYIEEEAYNLSIDIRDDEDRIKLKKLQKAFAWLEKQGKSKPHVTWFNTKDTTAPSERDIVGWYKTDGKLEPCPITVWFCSEEEGPISLFDRASPV